MDGWNEFEKVLPLLRTVYLWGPPGLGKTSASLAALDKHVQGKAVMLTLSEDIVLQEILGHYLPNGRKFVWHDGPAVTAIKSSALVVNELARASGAVKDAMLGLMDGQQVARIALPSGENISPWDGFKLIATSNSPLEELEPALRDRFEAVIKIDRPHEDLVKFLNRGFSGLGSLISDSYADGEQAVSVRAGLTFLKLLARLDQKEAGSIAFRERWADIANILKIKQ